LTWNNHILTVVNKARQVNNFLHRNFYQCPPYLKCNLCKSMVRPIREFASPVWDPHTLLNINRLKSIQRSAARFCYNDYVRTSGVTSMLNKLNLPLLEERKFRSKSIMMYKILNNLIDIPTHYFVPNQLSLRNRYFTQLPIRVDSFKFSFFPSVIKIWNALPLFVTNSSTLDHFCNNLDKYIQCNHTCAL